MGRWAMTAEAGAELGGADLGATDRLRLLLHTMAGVPGEADAAELLVGQVAAATGAAGVALARLSGGSHLELLATRGFDARRWATLCPDRIVLETPLAEAAMLHRPATAAGAAEVRERWAGTAAWGTVEGALAVVPLRQAQQVVGVLVAVWHGTRDDLATDEPFLAAVADLAVLALGSGPTDPLDAPSSASLEMLRAMVGDAPVGFALFDHRLRFVMLNEALAQVNGLPVAEHLGRFVGDVLPEIDDDALAALRHVLATGEPLRDVEVNGRTPASSEYKTWLEDFYRVTSPAGAVLGVAVVLSDVTAERRSERRLRQVIDSLLGLVAMCLPDGTLVEVNRSALEAAGLSAADVLRRPLWEAPWFAWSPSVAATVRASVERAATGTPTRTDLDLQLAGGTVITVDYRLAPVVEHGRVVALVPSALDVTQRRRSVEQADGLANLARRLNVAATVDEVSDVIRAHSPGALGSLHASVGLVDEDGERVVLLQPQALPTRMVRRYSQLPLDSPLHVARAVRENRTLVIHDPVRDQDVGGDRALAERLRADRAAAGVTVSVATPLLGADGEPFGVLAVGWSRPPELDSELSARVRTVAELCAQSIERARLTDVHVLAARRTAALATLAQELASVVSLDAVVAAIARLAPQVLGAGSVALTLHGGGRSGPDPSPRTDAGTLLAVPVRDGADRVVGDLTVTWPDPVRLDPVLRATLDTVAEVCGQTLERARLHAAEHELVEGLQRRLLRPLPDVPGLDIHATYLAAQTAVGIGGDFYDGVLLPDGRLAVVLGDVAGHGMEAAADMAQLRTVLSTLLADGTPLHRLFARAEAALGQVATMSLATAVVAVVDQRRDRLAYVHAGHPSLVLRTPQGSTRSLEGGRGPLLGLGLDHARPASVAFPPGSTLVGYTDGLVEDRRESLQDGIDRLLRLARTGAPDAAGLAAAVLDGCLADRSLADDVALLVIRRTT